MCFRLLQELGVIEKGVEASVDASSDDECVTDRLKALQLSSESTYKLSAPVFNHDGDGAGEGDDELGENSYDIFGNVQTSTSTTTNTTTTTSNNYQENENDYDEENDSSSETDSESDSESKIQLSSTPPPPDYTKDPLFIHLTTRLSFKTASAMKACQLSSTLSSKPKPTKEGKETKEATDATPTPPPTNTLDPDALSAALDYLCLHLTDKELQSGFKENTATASKSKSKSILDKPSFNAAPPSTNSNTKSTKAPSKVVLKPAATPFSLAPVPDFKQVSE